MRYREVRCDRGNLHEKLGLERILCASQFTIPDWAVTSHDLACSNTAKSFSKHNQSSRTPDFSNSLVSSMSISSSSPMSLYLVHNFIIIAVHNVKLSLSISWCDDHESAPSTALYQVQHPLSAAYTECSINHVQHTPRTAYTEYSIPRVQHTLSTAYTRYSIHTV